MCERKAYTYREKFPTRGDKAVRAQSIRGKIALHGLYIPSGAPWRNALIAELLGFPAAVHDDQVDALGLVGQLLDRMTPGRVSVRQNTRERPPRKNDNALIKSLHEPLRMPALLWT